jgi:hypothetical protein
MVVAVLIAWTGIVLILTGLRNQRADDLTERLRPFQSGPSVGDEAEEWLNSR